MTPPLVVKVSALVATAIVVPASPPSSVVLVQEVAPAVEVSVPTTLAGPNVAPMSTITAPLVSACVITTSDPEMPPPPSLTPRVPPSAVLALASPSTSSHPHVSLDHIYTSSDVDSL